MDYASERLKFNDRIRDARTLLSQIKELESSETPPVDTEAVKMIRGLFYVNMYGLLERSINELFAGFLNAVAQLNVGTHLYLHTFLPVAMDSHFSSLGDPLAKRRFVKRIEFAAVLHRNEAVDLNASIFEKQLQNTKTMVVVDILKSMGAPTVQVESHVKRHYIDEIAEKRNQVAHGRASAREIGSAGRSAELEIRLLAVVDFYESVAQLLENFFNNREFLRLQG